MTDRDAVDLLRDLCAVYSPSGEEAGAVSLLVERANRAGLRACADDVGNFVAIVDHGWIRLLGSPYKRGK